MRVQSESTAALASPERAQSAARLPFIAPRERQRGVWPFLTWAFLLPQLVAAATLVDSNIKPVQDGDPDGAMKHANASQPSAPDNSNQDVSKTVIAPDVPQDENPLLPNAQ